MSESLSENRPHLRNYSLDWIRVLIILDLVPFHAAWLMTYNTGFSLIDPDSGFAAAMKIYVHFISLWHMPLLFFISGFSSRSMLKKYNPYNYLRERAFRLLVPLLFFMLILYPLVAYFWPSDIERTFSGYFLNFWPFCLKTLFYNDLTGGPRWAHMWFVAYLFIYSVIIIPFISYINSGKGQSLIHKISEVMNRKIILFLAGFIFVLTFALLSVPFPFYQNNLYSDWGYFTYNLFAFLLGFILSHHQHFWLNVEKSWRISLLMGLIITGALVWMIIVLQAFSNPGYNLRYLLFSLMFGLSTWFWVLAVLGLARKFLNKNTSFLKYFSQASYPFYIIHFVPMVILGSFLLKLKLNAPGEFILYNLTGLIITLLIYELVSQIPVFRFLFGLKGKAR